jgi:hypothetical protein
VIKFISCEPSIGPFEVAEERAFAALADIGGESGGGARPVDPQRIRDIIVDCRRKGVVAFHKQRGTYGNFPLVIEDGTTTAEAERVDPFGKSGGLVDGEIVREFPVGASSRRDAALAAI